VHLLYLIEKEYINSRHNFLDASLAELRLIRESVTRQEGNITSLRETVDRQGESINRQEGNITSLRETVDRQERNITSLLKTVDRQERNSSSFVEDRIRDIAGNIFGSNAMKRFLAKSIYDLVLLTSPFESPHEDLLTGESVMEVFARSHFVAFVGAFYQRACSTCMDPKQKKLLETNPWISTRTDGTKEIVIENIRLCGSALNKSQRAMRKRIMFVVESTDPASTPFKRTMGPGLAIVVWASTSAQDSAAGDFMSELELDCRGKVDLIFATRKAVVLGGEIKTSASDIPKAKKQLIRRFKVIATCLDVVHGIKRKETIFLGRVFYRNIEENSFVLESEDASEDGTGTLSFYYHRV